jgi:uncharacterized cupin superfamily protein
MVNEAPLEDSGNGLVPQGDGWFVLNARDAPWYHAEGRPALCFFESGEPEWEQLGINICVLWPGQPMARYHWESDQEDFLVISGEALAIVENEERPLKAWDLLHCPPHVSHVIVGAGDGPCVVVSMGAREHQSTPQWGGYPVNELAAKHGASTAEETTDPNVAYADAGPQRKPVRFQDGWLPTSSS